MSDDNSKEQDKGTAGAAAAVANSRAAEKLADSVGGLVQFAHNALDYLVGSKRITSVNTARAEGALLDARTQAAVERIKAEAAAETADFVRDREMRKTINRRAIVAEAQKALPPPGVPVSDEPVSKDFLHAFFEEFDGISDPEVHKIVGRLLAGEVVQPGSFPRRTMRVLRDLESSDFALFSALCRFTWPIGSPTPLVFEPNETIYLQHGLSFDKMAELESLGLLTFNGLGNFTRSGYPPKFKVTYGTAVVQIEMKDGVSHLDAGKVMLTDAGRRLAPLTNATMVPEFVEYVLGKWRAQGHKADVVNPAAPAASPPAEPSAAA